MHELRYRRSPIMWLAGAHRLSSPNWLGRHLPRSYINWRFSRAIGMGRVDILRAKVDRRRCIRGLKQAGILDRCGRIVR